MKQAVSRVPLFNIEGGPYDTPDEGLSAIARVEREKAAAHTVLASEEGDRLGQREQRKIPREEHTMVQNVSGEDSTEQPQGEGGNETG